MDEDSVPVTNTALRGKGSFYGRSPSSTSGGSGVNNANRSGSLPPNSELTSTALQQQIPLRRTAPPTLPPPPPGLTELQRKRRLIVQSIVHSENSYVATLQRLVNVSDPYDPSIVSNESKKLWLKVNILYFSYRTIKNRWKKATPLYWIQRRFLHYSYVCLKFYSAMQCLD